MVQVVNANPLTLTQLGLILAENPTVVAAISSAVGSLVASGILVAGSINSQGDLSFLTAGGETLPVEGSVVGPPGGPGPVSPMGTAGGVWNPGTNTPALASGGSGATAGTMLTIGGAIGATTVLSTAIDGITQVNQGDQLYQSGGAWVYVPRVGTGSFVNLSLVGMTAAYDGSANPTIYFTNGKTGAARWDSARINPDGSWQFGYVQSPLGSFTSASFGTLAVGSALTATPGNTTADHSWRDANGVEVLRVIPGGIVQAGSFQSNIGSFSTLTVAGQAITGSPSVGTGSSAIPLSNWLNIRLRPNLTLDDTVNSGSTYASVFTVDAPFDAIQLVQPYDQLTTCTIAKAKVAVSASAADPLNPVDGTGAAAPFYPVTFGNGGAAVPIWQQPDPVTSSVGSIVLPTSVDNNVETITLSDAVFVPCVPRSDSGSGYLAFVRGIATGSPRPVAVSDASNLNTVLGGRTTGDYFATGDYVTTTTGMPNSGLASKQLFSGIRVLCRSKVFNILVSGASLDAGDTTTDGCNNFGLQLAQLLSTAATPCSSWNGAQSGLNSADFTARAIAILNKIPFDMVTIRPHTVNDHYDSAVSQAAAQALADITWQRALMLYNYVVQGMGRKAVIMAPTPHPGQSAYSEQTRVNCVARLYAGNLDFVDPNTVCTNNAVSPPALYAQYDGGGGHMNDAGHAAVATLLAVPARRYLGLT